MESSDLLATVGQIAGIVLILELFVGILIALLFHLVIVFGVGWIEEKVSLIGMLQPIIERVNTTARSTINQVSSLESSNKVVHTVTQIPVYMNTAEAKVEQGSGIVVKAVIEYRARIVMVQSIIGAFFGTGAAKSTPNKN